MPDLRETVARAIHESDAARWTHTTKLSAPSFDGNPQWAKDELLQLADDVIAALEGSNLPEIPEGWKLSELCETNEDGHKGEYCASLWRRINGELVWIHACAATWQEALAAACANARGGETDA
jgi:hypothetical protein